METKYKIRIVLTVVLLTLSPVFYGLTDPSEDARYTLAAALSIPLIMLWVTGIAVVGTAIECTTATTAAHTANARARRARPGRGSRRSVMRPSIPAEEGSVPSSSGWDVA